MIRYRGITSKAGYFKPTSIMAIAYSPVNENEYNMLNKQAAPSPIRRITQGSSSTNDIYLIPYIAEERYQDGNPNASQKIEWTYDFGSINAGDIFVIDSQWDPKTMAFFATCLWDSPNYTGTPLVDNGWTKASFSTSAGNFATHENSIELGYFHNQSFSPKSSQFYCADFSEINLAQFVKGANTDSAYEMSSSRFLQKYQSILCDDPLGDCCKSREETHKRTIYEPKKFKTKSADKITNFDPSTDILAIDTDSFGVDSSATFATGKNKKTVTKKLAKQDFDFLYDQKKGGLYFNENGSDKGFGDGGIIAILKGAPDLTASNLVFL